MFNHLVEEAPNLIPLLKNPLGEDFYILRNFEKSISQPQAISYIWQFSNGGWVSVLENGAASIASLTPEDLQLSLAAMHAVSDISLLNVPYKYAKETESFLETVGTIIDQRTWVTFLKETPFAEIENSTSSVSILPATKDHLETVVQWQNRMFIENGVDIQVLESEKQHQELRKEIACGQLLILSNNVQPIGFVLLSSSEKKSVKRTTLRNIYIDTPYRRSGVGRYVIQTLVNKVIKQNEGPFFLMTVKDQANLIKFYEKLDFCKTAELHFFRMKKTEDNTLSLA